MNGSTLIMELNQEQGAGRETQVQPPLNVWSLFFGVELEDTSPVFLLTDQQLPNPEIETRPVIVHDHNITVEISGASPPRPAIIRIEKLTPTEFKYWVYRPEHDPEYGHCDWLLNTFVNPHWRRGRRWLIV